VIEAEPVAVGPGNTALVCDARYAAWRFVLQRASAAVLALCVVVHLATIIYAVRHGLTAQAIVARVHASVFWPAFYAVFVVAVAIHAPLGLRVIAEEWLQWRGRCSAAGSTPFIRWRREMKRPPTLAPLVVPQGAGRSLGAARRD
jgi:fumarate reductase subunit C